MSSATTNPVSVYPFLYFVRLARMVGVVPNLLLVCALAACAPDSARENTMQPNKPRVMYFSVNVHSYLEPYIFDVMLNGHELGVGAGALVVGVPVTLGEQKITWRMASNGDTMYAVNTPIFTAPTHGETYLGVHIYPDNTVEVIPEKFWPIATERGEAIVKQWRDELGLTITGCAEPLAELPWMQDLTSQQQKQWVFATDRVRHQTDINFPLEMGPRTPYANKCRFVAIVLTVAQKLGLTRLRDMVNFTALSLIYKERMQNDEHFLSLLDQVRQKKLTLDQALKQWDTNDDKPAIIAVRTRDVDDTPLF